jgi:regulator of cell morphogenesis and NO signaling
MFEALERTATLAEIVAAHAATARVFQRHDIDVRRRGDATVLEVCRERHLDPVEVFAQVEEAIGIGSGDPRSRPPRHVPDAALVSHLIENHHAFVRRVLPYVVPLLAKVAGRHGRRDPRLVALCDAGQQLADALEEYLEEEERVLFPALVAGDAGGAGRALPVLSGRQRDIVLLLARVRALTGGFVAPEWADRSYRVLLEELTALVEEVSEELHLESYALVPRMLSPAAPSGEGTHAKVGTPAGGG